MLRDIFFNISYSYAHGGSWVREIIVWHKQTLKEFMGAFNWIILLGFDLFMFWAFFCKQFLMPSTRIWIIFWRQKYPRFNGAFVRVLFYFFVEFRFIELLCLASNRLRSILASGINCGRFYAIWLTLKHFPTDWDRTISSLSFSRFDGGEQIWSISENVTWTARE